MTPSVKTAQRCRLYRLRSYGWAYAYLLQASKVQNQFWYSQHGFTLPLSAQSGPRETCGPASETGCFRAVSVAFAGAVTVSGVTSAAMSTAVTSSWRGLRAEAGFLLLRIPGNLL